MTTVERSVVNLDQLKRDIEAARSIQELKEIMDKAEALLQYGKKHGWLLEDQNNAAEATIRCARAIGELLEEIPKEPGKRTDLTSSQRETRLQNALQNAGVTRPDASRCQTIYKLPEETLEQHIAEVKDKRKELTKTSVLQLAKQQRQQEKQEQKAEQAKIVTLPQDIQLLHGDFRTLGHELLDESVDLIFTDPPYHQEHLQLWSDLGALADRVLKPGGILLAYSGQIFLPHVLNLLSEHLTYCWLLGVAHTGGHIQIWKHNIWNDWKPILMFSKGKPVEHEWLMDLYRGDKGDKQAHEWAQGEGEAAYFIEKLTKPGQLIVDPMCGSGTILRAAYKLQRSSLGMEIDEERYTMALAGMKDVVSV